MELKTDPKNCFGERNPRLEIPYGCKDRYMENKYKEAFYEIVEIDLEPKL